MIGAEEAMVGEDLGYLVGISGRGTPGHLALAIVADCVLESIAPAICSYASVWLSIMGTELAKGHLSGCGRGGRGFCGRLGTNPPSVHSEGLVTGSEIFLWLWLFLSSLSHVANVDFTYK